MSEREKEREREGGKRKEKFLRNPLSLGAAFGSQEKKKYWMDTTHQINQISKPNI